jgi:PKD repeat protein
MPDAGRATFTVGGEAPPTPPAPEPDPIPDPEPPASGVPPGGTWTPLYADGDEGFDPVNLADVAAQTDGQRLYVRVTYHGDYASTSLLDAAVYVDADADETTGFGLTNSLGRQVLGAEYVISARPSGGRVYPWDATAGTFVEGGPALAYDAPDYAADEHVVGAALSDLGVAPTATIDLAVMLFDTSGSQYDRIDEVPNAGESALTFALGADDGGGGDDGPTTPDLQWQPLGTDPDDPALLDLGSVAAAVADDRLYLRVGYHGDYAASSPVDAAVYVDADADLTTGAVFRDGTDTVVLGADYVISAQPDGTGGVFAWDATSSGFARHADLAFDGPVFDADQHVVAANLSDLGLDGTADTVQVVVRQFDTTGGGFVAIDDLPNAGALTVAVGDGPPAPPTVGAPTGEWFRLGTAADDPAIPVDLAALDAQDDGATLYLRVGFHGDYAATTARTTTVYLDADDDPGTGLRFLSLTGPTFGADYVLEMRPSGTTLQAYDPVTRALVPAGPAAYHAPDFDADTHAVGVTLAQLGVPSPTVVGVLVRQDGLVGTQFRTDQLPASPVAYPVAGGDGAGSDRFEPNDLVGQGPTLTPGTYADLRVVGRDVDRFGVTLAVGDRVTASLASVQGTSAVDLVLRSPDGIARAFADSGSDGTLEYLVPVGEAGTYVLEAAAENETGDATYALTIAVSTATVLPDRFEPNDAIGEETPLTPGTYPDLSIIESDIDGFAVVVDAGATLVVNLTFAHADADLDVRVYAPNGTLLGSGISETDNESVRVVAATTGTYIIDVEAFEGRGAARYDLLVRVEDDGTTPAPPPTPGPGPGDGNGSGPVPFDRPIPGSGSSLPPIDHDGDGRYEDVDGNGRFDFVDVISLVFARLDVVNADPTMRDALNFDGEGNVNFLDVIELVFQL